MRYSKPSRRLWRMSCMRKFLCDVGRRGCMGTNQRAHTRKWTASTQLGVVAVVRRRRYSRTYCSFQGRFDESARPADGQPASAERIAFKSTVSRTARPVPCPQANHACVRAV